MIAVLSWHYHAYKHELQPGFSVMETLAFYWHHVLTLCGCVHTSQAQEDTAVLPAVSSFF